MTRGNAKKKLLYAVIALMLARGYSATTVELALAALDQFLLLGRRILLAGAYQAEEDPARRMFGFPAHKEPQRDAGAIDGFRNYVRLLVDG